MNKTLTALIVDDEPLIRRLTTKALREVDFECEEAADGEQAMERLGRRQFDVVITDLRMPKRHGHSLAVELIGREGERPLIVVLTGVLEPRLAADLIARGVDDIVFKPVDYRLLGAKVRALWERKSRQRAQATGGQPAATTGKADGSSLRCLAITAAQIEHRLDAMAGSLPVSQASIELVNLLQDSVPSVDEVARLVSRDPALTVEVLRLANSVFYNPSGKRIDHLQTAIVRVGQRPISELALASTTLRALSSASLPWLDADLVWQRSLAGSLAIEQLCPRAELGADDEGLFLTSLLLPMGRVLLGAAFPELYQQMVDHCRQTGCSLASLERRFLPLSAPIALAGTLARWKLSPRLFKPLEHVDLSYQEIAHLAEPLCLEIQRLKAAELLAQIAVGRYEPWDEIDFPPPEMAGRLGSKSLEEMLARIRAGLEKMRTEAAAAGPVPACAKEKEAGRQLAIRYLNLTDCSDDFLLALLQAHCGNVVCLDAADDATGQPIVVNSLNVSAEYLRSLLDQIGGEVRWTVIRSEPLPAEFAAPGPVVLLPTSFKLFSEAVSAAAI